MRAYFLAERLKYRRTVFVYLLVFMPVLLVFLAASLTGSFFVVDSYNWWYMGLYPGLIGIVCGMIGGKDKKKKNVTIGSLPCSMERIWDAKVLVGAAASGMAMLCTILLTLIAETVMEYLLHVTFIYQPPIKAQLLAGVLIWLTSLWQVPFCLFLSQKTGLFWMLLLHMGSDAVVSAIFSLKPWFAFFPGAITSRLMCPVLGILPNGLLAVEGMMTYSGELMEPRHLLTGVIAAAFWFFIFWLGSRKWFQRQVTAL